MVVDKSVAPHILFVYCSQPHVSVEVGESSKEDILNDIASYYLESQDFNGLPLRVLMSRFESDRDRLVDALLPLIQEEKVSIVFGDIHPNPYIRAFPDQ